MQDKSLGNILVDQNTITEEQLQKGLLVQREKGIKLGEALNKEAILKAVSYQLGMPYLNTIHSESIPSDLIEDVPLHFAKRNEIIPLREHPHEIDVAIANPVNHPALDDLRLIFKKSIKPYIASATDITDAINIVYNRESSGQRSDIGDFEGTNLDNMSHDFDEPQDLLDADDEAPIIRLVNSLLFRAVKQNASDIHIEPFEKELVVRFRIDGVLYDIMHPPKKIQNSVISRIKIMADLNIAEKRLPQDGRIRIKLAGKDIDIRVSTLPTSFGESVVMRLLDKTRVLLDLSEIGVTGSYLDKMEQLIQHKHGIILVTGPTGSGKTTTLYAMLSQINHPDIKIITVEDPVEYQIPGINQIQVNPKIDLTFAAGLRSILRQDPDVVMIGEIRDRETAEIAIQASLTGHLVISTLHTNDASSAMTRLIDMGVEPFLVSSSLIGVIAQRLVRTLCHQCRESYYPNTEVQLRLLGLTAAEAQQHQIFRAQGCQACIDTGYVGRTGVHEILMIDDEVRTLIMQNAGANIIKKKGMELGMKTLREVGAEKVLAGVTSVEEVLRVTQEDVARVD